MITIKNCTFSYRCPKDWDALQADAADPKRRNCHECRRDVHLCETDDELIARVKAGDCIAIRRPPSPAERPDDDRVMMVGEVSPPAYEVEGRFSGTGRS